MRSVFEQTLRNVITTYRIQGILDNQPGDPGNLDVHGVNSGIYAAMDTAAEWMMRQK